MASVRHIGMRRFLAPGLSRLITSKSPGSVNEGRIHCANLFHCIRHRSRHSAAIPTLRPAAACAADLTGSFTRQ